MSILKYYLSKLILKIQIPSITDSRIDKTAHVNSKSHIVNSSMGKYSFCAYGCEIINTDIGAFCSIASNVTIGTAMHPIEFGSTSPVFLEGNNALKKNFSNHKFEAYKRTVIGDDVWIGCNVVIKSGVTIGTGAIIGMGSIVTKDIQPYEIWGGNPAHFIRNRFDNDIINDLKNLKWDKLDYKDIYKLAKHINNPKELINSFQNCKKI